MSDTGEMTPERRATLAEKARRLYGKFCGTGGRGICAESFALYHIGRGEPCVAEDLAGFLDTVVAALERDDPDGRLDATRGLAARVRRHLAEASGDTPRVGQALRRFVYDSAAGEACAIGD